MFKASKIIKYVTTSQGKQIAIDFVTHTDKWERKTLASSVKDDFVAVVEKKYKDTLDPEVVKVAIKEAEHTSENDPVTHFSVVELDKDDKVHATEHYYSK